MYKENKGIVISGILLVLLSVCFNAVINFNCFYDGNTGELTGYFIKTIIRLGAGSAAFAFAYKYGRSFMLKYGWIFIPAGILSSVFYKGGGYIDVFNYSIEMASLTNTLAITGFASYFYKYCLKSIIHTIIFWISAFVFLIALEQNYLTLILFVMVGLMLISAMKNKLIGKKSVWILNALLYAALLLRTVNILSIGIAKLEGLFYDSGYMAFIARCTYMKIKWFGAAVEPWLIGGNIAGYKLLWIFSLFGIVAGAAVLATLSAFVFFVCKKCLKNGLTDTAPIACATASILIVRFVISVLANFGIVIDGLFTPVLILSDGFFGYIAIFVLTGLITGKETANIHSKRHGFAGKEMMELSENKTLKICSIKQLFIELDKNLPDRKTIAIFMTMEMLNHPNLRLLDGYHKVGVFDTEIKQKAFSFDYREGMQVKEFLEKHNDFGQIYVCCDSGESRSTAMAAAIMRYYGKSDKEIWINPYYHPNLLVYKEQLFAFGIKISKLRLKYLKYLNNLALKRAINKNR